MATKKKKNILRQHLTELANGYAERYRRDVEFLTSCSNDDLARMAYTYGMDEMAVYDACNVSNMTDTEKLRMLIKFISNKELSRARAAQDDS